MVVGIVVFLDELFVEADCALLLVDEFLLVLLQLTLDDFFHQINGNVHVVADLFGTDHIALHGDRYLDLLPFLLHTECDDCLLYTSRCV